MPRLRSSGVISVGLEPIKSSFQGYAFIKFVELLLLFHNIIGKKFKLQTVVGVALEEKDGNSLCQKLKKMKSKLRSWNSCTFGDSEKKFYYLDNRKINEEKKAKELQTLDLNSREIKSRLTNPRMIG